MPYSHDDAVEKVHKLLGRNLSQPIDKRVIILNDWTTEKSWGWIFFTNSEKYSITRNSRDAWTGPGPIFFNRFSGEIRRFGSGQNTASLVYDYEMEMEANGKIWTLWLSNSNDRKKTILKMKSLLRIDTNSAREIVQELPTPVFWGIRRHLEWLKLEFERLDITAFINLEEELPDCSEFKVPGRFENLSDIRAHHAYHDHAEPGW